MKLLSPQELEEVKQYVLRELLRVIRQDPLFVASIEEMIRQHFPGQAEFDQLLEELAAFRREVTRRLDRQELRLDRIEQDVSVLKQDVSVLKQDMTEVKSDIRTVKRDIARLQSGQDNLIKRADRVDAWMQVTVGRMGSDKGTQLEDTFAAALRFGLNNPQLHSSDLRLRVKLTDHEGLIYPRGFSTEVDVVSSNGQRVVFEIKAAAEIDQVDIFALKLRLFKLQNPDQLVRGVIFSVGINDDLKARCENYGIELIQPF